MELKVYDRLILLNILPAQGDIFTLKLIRKLREALSFTEEEHETLQFKVSGQTYEVDGELKTVPEGVVHWNTEMDALKEISIGQKAKEIIKERFEEISKQKSMNEAQLNVYEKFVDLDEVSLDD